MSKKESKAGELFNRIANIEGMYNMLINSNYIKIECPMYDEKKFADVYVIEDKEVLDTIADFYGKRINKLKQELKKELDKKL